MMAKTSQVLVNLASIWVTKLLLSHLRTFTRVKGVKSVEPSLWAISTFWFFWTFREAQRQALAQEQSSDKSLTWASPLISEHTTLVREKAGINRARGGGNPFPTN